MKSKYELIMGIDPDITKSGVTGLYTATNEIRCHNMAFPELLDYLETVRHLEIVNEAFKIMVIVEAGWLISHNWHVKQGQKNSVAAAIGNHSGRNHETGRKIVEMCKHYGLKVVEQAPLRKFWKGADGKITHGELESLCELNKIKGLGKQTNQEIRDSCLLTFIELKGFKWIIKNVK